MAPVAPSGPLSLPEDPPWLYKTYTHKIYTGTRGFSVSAAPDILSSVKFFVKAVVKCMVTVMVIVRVRVGV
jgi:hypothetical protein